MRLIKIPFFLILFNTTAFGYNPKLGNDEYFLGIDYTRTKLERHLKNWTTVYDLDHNIVRGLISQESGWYNRAVSKKGARGLMQVMPRTARYLGMRKGESLFNPYTNMYYGCLYLRRMLDRFGSYKLALVAYYGGPRRARQLRDEQFRRGSRFRQELLDYVSNVFEKALTYYGVHMKFDPETILKKLELDDANQEESLSKIIKKIKKWSDLPHAERRNIIDAFNSSSTQIELSRPQRKYHVVCPHTSAEVVIPCSLQDCRYFVDYLWSKNCILSYLAEHGKDSLNEEEIAFLHKIPLDEVKRTIRKATALLRKQIILEQLQENRAPSFEFIPGFCVNCQAKLEEVINDLALDGNYGYCSLECKGELSPPVWKLEHKLKFPFREIFFTAASIFPSISILEDTFEIPRGTLRKALRRNSKALEVLNTLK
jgi:hypothetical protein